MFVNGDSLIETNAEFNGNLKKTMNLLQVVVCLNYSTKQMPIFKVNTTKTFNKSIEFQTKQNEINYIYPFKKNEDFVMIDTMISNLNLISNLVESLLSSNLFFQKSECKWSQLSKDKIIYSGQNVFICGAHHEQGDKDILVLFSMKGTNMLNVIPFCICNLEYLIKMTK